MATSAEICILTKDGKLKGVRCNYDGYLYHTGKILLENYNTKTLVTKLLSLGDMSALQPKMNKPVGHSFSKPVDGYTIFYGRDRGEDNVSAKKYDTVEDVFSNCNVDYVYVFWANNNSWYFCKPKGELESLTKDDVKDDVMAKGGGVDGGKIKTNKELSDMYSQMAINIEEEMASDKGGETSGMNYEKLAKLQKEKDKYTALSIKYDTKKKMAQGGEVDEKKIEELVEKKRRRWYSDAGGMSVMIDDMPEEDYGKVIDGFRKEAIEELSNNKMAKGGGVGEYWSEINESTLNERLPYDMQDVNEDEDLISGNIWIKFKKSPLEMPDYELKRAISEDFEYFGYGNQKPPKNVSLKDGSWGSFYIDVENLTLTEIKELLLNLPEQVQERLEDKKIKGYKDLGFDTYGQTLDLRVTQSEDEEEYALGGGIGKLPRKKFLLYTNPNNVTNRGYVAIGEDVKDVLRSSREYKDSYTILYQGTGTNEDLQKAKSMYSNYRFGNDEEIMAKGGGIDKKIKDFNDVKPGDIGVYLETYGDHEVVATGYGSEYRKKLEKYDLNGFINDMKNNPTGYGMKDGDFEETPFIVVKVEDSFGIYTYDETGVLVYENETNDKVPGLNASKQLSILEVDALYRREPKLDDPYYPKSLIKQVGDIAYYMVMVNEDKFLLAMDTTGNYDDKWYFTSGKNTNNMSKPKETGGADIRIELTNGNVTVLHGSSGEVLLNLQNVPTGTWDKLWDFLRNKLV